MKSPKELKSELEELCIFNVEQDIIDFPHNKSDFSPYVVVSLSKGLPKEDVVTDVFTQLDQQIKHEELFPVLREQPSKKEKMIRWLEKHLKFSF